MCSGQDCDYFSGDSVQRSLNFSNSWTYIPFASAHDLYLLKCAVKDLTATASQDNKSAHLVQQKKVHTLQGSSAAPPQQLYEAVAAPQLAGKQPQQQCHLPEVCQHTNTPLRVYPVVFAQQQGSSFYSAHKLAGESSEAKTVAAFDPYPCLVPLLGSNLLTDLSADSNAGSAVLYSLKTGELQLLLGDAFNVQLHGSRSSTKSSSSDIHAAEPHSNIGRTAAAAAAGSAAAVVWAAPAVPDNEELDSLAPVQLFNPYV